MLSSQRDPFPAADQANSNIDQQQLHSPTPEVVDQASKTSKYLGFTLLGFALLLIVGAAYYFWWYSSRSRDVNQIVQLPQPETSHVATNTPQPTPYVDHEFFWKVVDRETGTVILDKTEYDRDVAYKAPNLYFRYKDNPQELIQLNLETGEEKVVYTEESYRNVNSIQLVNNILFFTTGGYMEGGALFYLDENGSAQELDDHEFGGGAITQEAGNYWLQGGSGDSCWGQSRYSLITFNPQPTVMPKVESHFGCNDGEQVLALTPTHFVMTEHTVDESIEAMGFPASVFSSIFTRSIQDPGQKTELVSSATMPKQVVGIEYDKEHNQLWLLGNTPAVYDVASNQVLYFDQPMPFTPSSWGEGGWMISETESEMMERSEIGYCVEQLGQNQSFIRGYILNFQRQTIEELSAPCPVSLFPATDYDAESKEKIQLTFKELGLPENYSLEIYQTEVIY